jgi:hypothetical protein
MAWEEFQRGAVRGVTGDEPFDEMRSAVERIRRSYFDRFGRNPYFAELLHVLQATVEADPPAYVTDDALPTLERLVESVGTNAKFEHIDPDNYEGAFDAENEDFLVFPRPAAPDSGTTRSPVLRGQVTEAEDSISCRYAILSPSITDGMAKSLIRQCVLHDLLGYNLTDRGLAIQFEREPQADQEQLS